MYSYFGKLVLQRECFEYSFEFIYFTVIKYAYFHKIIGIQYASNKNHFCKLRYAMFLLIP